MSMNNNKLTLANVYFWLRGSPGGAALSFNFWLVQLVVCCALHAYTATEWDAAKGGEGSEEQRDGQQQQQLKEQQQQEHLANRQKKATNLVIMATRAASLVASLHICVCVCGGVFACAWVGVCTYCGRGRTHLLRSV